MQKERAKVKELEASNRNQEQELKKTRMRTSSDTKNSELQIGTLQNQMSQLREENQRFQAEIIQLKAQKAQSTTTPPNSMEKEVPRKVPSKPTAPPSFPKANPAPPSAPVQPATSPRNSS